jgi:hypothetical protein
MGNSPYRGISRHIVRHFMGSAELVAPSDFIRKGCVLLAKVALWRAAHWGDCGQSARGGACGGRCLYAVCDFNGRLDRDGHPMGIWDFVSALFQPQF